MTSNWFKNLFQSWEVRYLSQSVDHADLKRRQRHLEDRRAREILYATYGL